MARGLRTNYDHIPRLVGSQYQGFESDRFTDSWWMKVTRPFSMHFWSMVQRDRWRSPEPFYGPHLG